MVLLVSIGLVAVTPPRDALAYEYTTVGGGGKYAAVQVRVGHDPTVSSWQYRRIVKSTHSGSRGGTSTNTSWTLTAARAGIHYQDGGKTYSLNKTNHNGYIGGGTNYNCVAISWDGCDVDHYWWRLTNWQGRSISSYLFAETSTWTSGGNFPTTNRLRFYAGPWN